MADSLEPTDKAGDAIDDAKPAQVSPSIAKEKRQGRSRSGGFLSLFRCASAKGSASPPVARPSSTGGNISNNGAKIAVVDSPRRDGGTAAACDQAPDPKHVYNMRHGSRGVALVFNFQEFVPELGLSYRHGSDKDTVNVVIELKRLKFHVNKFNNLSAIEFLSQLRQVSEVNHRDSDAIAVVIMSHGEEGVIFASDAGIPLSEVFEPFRQCGSLVGKPKLFFIQACRGSKFDSGKEEADSGDLETEDSAFKRALDDTDGIKTIQRLPTDADFLICYSVVPGYFSWRNGAYGSWFVQKLTEVLKTTDCSQVEFMRAMTRVNRAVAYEFESHTNNPQLDRKKQVPSIVSMLTKELYFPVK